MKKLYVAVIVSAVAILVIFASFLINFWNIPNTLKHETGRWAVIEDVNGDCLAVEPFRDEVWLQLVQMQQNESRMWIGGIVETYDNKWSFRFKPKNVTVAEVTAEGLQASIRSISENLNYWLGGWAYVSAKVTEIHSP